MRGGIDFDRELDVVLMRARWFKFECVIMHDTLETEETKSRLNYRKIIQLEMQLFKRNG